jgi:NCS1 family nucleobase:cation symporter-1
MLNFGDFSRYCKSFRSVKRGNFWGLPVNFLAFSLVTVITTAATLPVFGQLITDPVETVGRIDHPTAVILGALTFTIATIGINIVANFVSPAFDFSNVAPKLISWRMGGMMAATASIFITPWNLFNNPAVIHYTLDILGSFIGPLYGVLILDFYLVKRGKLVVDDHEGREPPCGDGAPAGRRDRDSLRDAAVARRRREFLMVHRCGTGCGVLLLPRRSQAPGVKLDL